MYLVSRMNGYITAFDIHTKNNSSVLHCFIFVVKIFFNVNKQILCSDQYTCLLLTHIESMLQTLKLNRYFNWFYKFVNDTQKKS